MHAEKGYDFSVLYFHGETANTGRASVMFHQVHGTKEFAASFSKQRKSANLARI